MALVDESYVRACSAALDSADSVVCQVKRFVTLHDRLAGEERDERLRTQLLEKCSKINRLRRDLDSHLERLEHNNQHLVSVSRSISAREQVRFLVSLLLITFLSFRLSFFFFFDRLSPSFLLFLSL